MVQRRHRQPGGGLAQRQQTERRRGTIVLFQPSQLTNFFESTFYNNATLFLFHLSPPLWQPRSLYRTSTETRLKPQEYKYMCKMSLATAAVYQTCAKMPMTFDMEEATFSDDQYFAEWWGGCTS